MNEYLDIWLEILVLQGIGFRGEAVYPIFQKYQDQLDLDFAETISQWFHSLLDPDDIEKNKALARILNAFAIDIQQFPLGSRANNLEIAIVAYEVALEVLTRSAFPEDWAMTQNNLGIAYQTRIRGERADNIEQAIRCYEAALEVTTRTAFPYEWTETQNNLGLAYNDRIRGERADNIEQAIRCYEAALEVRTRTAFPKGWANTQNNLGNAYRNRIRGERAQNLEDAIACYQAALEIRTRDAFPQYWAKAQNNLGAAYRNRIWGERAQNLEDAIACYEAALEVYSRTAFPEDWAMTQNNLGLAYNDRIRGEQADNIEQAIRCYEAALEVYSRTAFPEQWAMTQNNLAKAYFQCTRGERADNIEEAIRRYDAALEVLTRTAFPEKWARSQNNLGLAYNDRIRGERADNIEEAIRRYDAALEVLTCTAFPEDWARTQNNLGNAYRNRIQGERADNIEEAIRRYQAALEVYSRTAFPEQWATTQMNLGNAYRNRIRGERADNIEQAIRCYQAALEVYSRTAFPEQWAMTQNNLGLAYNDRIRGERAQNLEDAITCYRVALEVRTRSAYPEDWAETQHNLGIAYRNRIRGERAQNLEDAIACYRAILEVVTRSAYPENWAQMQNSLGVAYRNRIRGEQAQNLEDAIACYRAALEVRTRTASPEQWAAIQNNLGEAYRNRLRGEQTENREKSIASFQAASEVYTRDAFPEQWAITQNNLGNAYSDRSSGERVQNPAYFLTLNYEAIRCYQAALEVYTRDAFPEKWAITQNNLGLAYSSHSWLDQEKAIGCFRAALAVLTPSTLPLDCLNTARNLGNLGYALQNWEIAIEGYNQAILAIEQSRYWATSEATKRELIANSLDIYQNMVQACINHQDYAQALLTVERSKSRTLLELLDSANLYPKNATDAQKQRISDLRRQIAIYQQQLAYTSRDSLTPATEKHPNQPSPETLIRQQLQSANQQFQDLLTELDDPNFTLTQQVPAQLPDLRRLLPPQTALMEWYLPREAESGFYAFLVTRRDEQIQITPHHFSAEDRQHLDQALQDYRSDYGKPSWNQQLPQRLETLSAALQLPRLLAELSEIQHLILIPHRELHLIPLHALPVPSSPLSRSGRGAGGEGKPLQDGFPVQYAPSCQILNNLQQRPPLNRETVPFFAIQNPTNPDNLPFAEWGVELLLRQFSPHQVLRRDQATRANLTQPHSQTFLEQSHAVHFGCHGEFDEANPLNAYLKLANGEKLTFLEIFNGLNIPLCRLLVLSACKTGLVETSHTDDYVGLSSAFFYAGARTVVASLWNVDELAATLVTLRLYQILPDYPSVTVALQAAQTWLRGVSSADVLDWLKQEQKATEEELEEVEDRLSLFDDPPFANAYYWSAFTAAGL